MPTVLLSNHPGHAHVSGERIGIVHLAGMLDAISRNGALAGVDAVLSGYLPTAAHVEFVRDAVQLVRSVRPAALYLADPVLGDHPKGLYVDVAAARAVRELLLPIADIATPNLFELEWLSGRPAPDRSAAADVARGLGPAMILATSVPGDGDGLETIVVERSQIAACRVDRLAGVPHGTGDFLSGSFLGALLSGRSPVASLGASVGAVQAAIRASLGAKDLALASSRDAWASAAPATVHLYP